MKLSIITINYNNAEGLQRTMESVLNQSCRDFEYIVIDGGSSDASKDIILSHRDRLSHWVSEPDNGIYNAMNKGVRVARGEYCLFLNSGDTLVSPDSLKRSVELLGDYDIHSFSLESVRGKIKYIQNPPAEISFYSFYRSSLPHPSTFIRRTLFDRVGLYNEAYRIVSDWCFFIDACIKYQASYKAEEMVISHFAAGGISSENGDKAKIEEDDYLKKHYARIYVDYLEDEALSNVVYFISQQKGGLKIVLLFPFLVLNRVFHLRNRLARRIRVKSERIV